MSPEDKRGKPLGTNFKPCWQLVRLYDDRERRNLQMLVRCRETVLNANDQVQQDNFSGQLVRIGKQQKQLLNVVRCMETQCQLMDALQQVQ
jgi:Mg2+ and Co2+ transporter CorA